MTDTLTHRVSELERRIEGLESRIASLESGGYEHRIRALERGLENIVASMQKVLEAVQRIELREVEREVSMLRDLLKIAGMGGAGGGAVGTGAYLLLQALQT